MRVQHVGYGRSGEKLTRDVDILAMVYGRSTVCAGGAGPSEEKRRKKRRD